MGNYNALFLKNSFRKLNVGMKTKSKSSTSSIIEVAQGSRWKTSFRQVKENVALRFNSTSPFGKREAAKQGRFLRSFLALLPLSAKTNLIEKL